RGLRTREDPLDGFRQRPNVHIGWWHGSTLLVIVVNEDCPAARPAPRFDIPPAVPHHEAGRQIDAVPLRRGDDEAGARLAAVTACPVVVIADENLLQRDLHLNRAVDRLDTLAALRASRDIGLVGHSNRQKASLPKTPHRGRYGGRNPQLTEIRRWMRPPVPANRIVQYPIAIQEHSTPRSGDSRHGLRGLKTF